MQDVQGRYVVLRFEFAVQGVEMRRRMIFPIHSDDNSEELTDGRHAAIIKAKGLTDYGYLKLPVHSSLSCRRDGRIVIRRQVSVRWPGISLDPSRIHAEAIDATGRVGTEVG